MANGRLSSGNWITIAIAILGMLASSGGTWAALSSDIAVLKTKVVALETTRADDRDHMIHIDSNLNVIKTDIAVIKDKMTRMVPE